jgi:hypothetical protein
MEPTQYPYSLKFSVATILLMLLTLLILFLNVNTAHSEAGWVIFGFFCFLFGCMLVLLVAKRLIPALKGDIALELAAEGINDYIRDVSIEWKDVKEIELIRGRTAALLRVSLKWVSDYGSEIVIPLRWVKGSDQDIYETALAYFDCEYPDATDHIT